MGDLFNFIMIIAPAGIVLAHSLVTEKHFSQRLEDMHKHNDMINQLVAQEMLKHLRTQDEVITSLRRQVNEQVR